MTFLLLLPAALSALVLGAHFLRVGHLVLTLLSLALIPLLFVRRPWAARAVQAAMVVSAAIWLHTTLSIAHQRAQFGEPYLRMALILGSVAAVALLAAILIQSRRARRHFNLLPAGML